MSMGGPNSKVMYAMADWLGFSLYMDKKTRNVTGGGSVKVPMLDTTFELTVETTESHVGPYDTVIAFKVIGNLAMLMTGKSNAKGNRTKLLIDFIDLAKSAELPYLVRCFDTLGRAGILEKLGPAVVASFEEFTVATEFSKPEKWKRLAAPQAA